MPKMNRKTATRMAILVISFLVIVPGGAFLFQDSGYVGSGIGTLAWGLVLLWHFNFPPKQPSPTADSKNR